jgi:histidinol-phosphate aminotransferase
MKYLCLKFIQLKLILIKVDDANKRYNELIKNVIRNRTTQPFCENTLRLTME